jgi:hypothetical protein
MSNTSQTFGMWLPFLMAYCYHPVKGKGWCIDSKKKQIIVIANCAHIITGRSLVLVVLSSVPEKNEFNRFKMK